VQNLSAELYQSTDSLLSYCRKWKDLKSDQNIYKRDILKLSNRTKEDLISVISELGKQLDNLNTDMNSYSKEFIKLEREMRRDKALQRESIESFTFWCKLGLEVTATVVCVGGITFNLSPVCYFPFLTAINVDLTDIIKDGVEALYKFFAPIIKILDNFPVVQKQTSDLNIDLDQVVMQIPILLKKLGNLDFLNIRNIETEEILLSEIQGELVNFLSAVNSYQNYAINFMDNVAVVIKDHKFEKVEKRVFDLSWMEK